MHYKNKAEAKIGHVVIGKTHNSNGKLRMGKILELMPQQGPCNVKLAIISFAPQAAPKEHDEPWFNRFVGSEMLTTRNLFDNEKLTLEVAVDYADVREILPCSDCFRMLNAILQYGDWDSSFFPTITEF